MLLYSLANGNVSRYSRVTLKGYLYGQFSLDHLRRSVEGIGLFNQQFYWECHEVFEDLWKEDRGDHARYVWWAIIQVAAAMIHYRDQKITGARGLIAKAKGKFDKCEELAVETPVMEEYLEWPELKRLVRRVPVNAEIGDFGVLFDFRFKKYQELKLL